MKAVTFTGEDMAEILQTLVAQHHFRVPIYVAVVSKNGAMMMGHYYEDGGHLSFKMTGESVGFAMFELPVNIMFVDGPTGRAAHVALKKGHKPKYALH